MCVAQVCQGSNGQDHAAACVRSGYNILSLYGSRMPCMYVCHVCMPCMYAMYVCHVRMCALPLWLPSALLHVCIYAMYALPLLPPMAPECHVCMCVCHVCPPSMAPECHGMQVNLI